MAKGGGEELLAGSSATGDMLPTDAYAYTQAKLATSEHFCKRQFSKQNQSQQALVCSRLCVHSGETEIIFLVFFFSWKSFMEWQHRLWHVLATQTNTQGPR